MKCKSIGILELQCVPYKWIEKCSQYTKTVSDNYYSLIHYMIVCFQFLAEKTNMDLIWCCNICGMFSKGKQVATHILQLSLFCIVHYSLPAPKHALHFKVISQWLQHRGPVFCKWMRKPEAFPLSRKKPDFLYQEHLSVTPPPFFFNGTHSVINPANISSQKTQ